MNLDRLKETLCKDLDKLAMSDSFSMGELEKIKVLTDSIKNIGKIEEHGYSQDGGWVARGNYGNSGYDRGNSYANRGMHYVRGHYSRGMGEEIEEMMHDPNMSSRDKETLRRAMEILK